MHCDRFALQSNVFFSQIVGKKKYLLYQLISKEQKMAIILFCIYLEIWPSKILQKITS